MGGRPLTMTVEGRERYPVRVRYARDFRDDLKALKRILVSARASSEAWGRPGMGGCGGMGAASCGGTRADRNRSRFPWPRWPTSASSKGRR